MTDKELIQAARICRRTVGCGRCELFNECPGRAAYLAMATNRLEALLAENAEWQEKVESLVENGCAMRKEIQKLVFEKSGLELEIGRLEAVNDHLCEVTKMVPRWRPVSEPPKESATVLARDMVGVVTTAYYNGSWHGMLNCDAATHWMPLPSTEGVE